LLTWGAGLNPELMEQERQLGPEPSDADTPPPRRRRGAAANTGGEHGEQCKHVSNLHVILHNRHQQLGSHCIMLSVGAEKAFLGHANCTMHPFFFWWGLLHGPQQGPDRMKEKKPIRLGEGILLPKQKNPP